MALSVDWVRQDTATTGTGVITLGAAYSNAYIRMQDDSRITDGAIVNYTIEDGEDRERGIGTYTSSGTTLTRTLVQATLVSGTLDDSSPAAISLTGGAVVSVSPVADDRNFRGALVYHSATQAVANTSLVTAIWDSETYDTDGFHDNATNNDRLTVPTGVSKVRLLAHIDWQGSPTGERFIQIKKNGGSITGGGYSRTGDAGSNNMIHNAASSVVDVIAGDYFTVTAYQTSGSSKNINAQLVGLSHCFSIEVIE